MPETEAERLRRRLGYVESVLRALVSSPTLPHHNRIMVRDALGRIDKWAANDESGATDPGLAGSAVRMGDGR